ncbi:MAG: rod shape-determining protein MreC [Solirubrobacterales bacterium]
MYRKQVRRRRAVLALLIVSSFVLLTITYGHGSSSLQRGVSTVFSPLQGVADRALKPARDLVDWFDKTFDARGENSRLKAELTKERKQAVAGQAALQEDAQLRKLLVLDRSPALASTEYKPVTGSVIARSPTVWQSVVTIDLGSGDGVHVDDPVMSGVGLVGMVTSVAGGSSQVTLLTDQASAVTAKIVPQGVQGEIRPDIGDPESLILDFINANDKVHKGESVVTSGWHTQGLASHFPPNLPIGEVTHASIVEQEASQQIRLRPYVDMADLDIVQVLTGGSRR